MKIERSLSGTHLPQRSEAARQQRRRLLIALGAGALPCGLAGELSGGIAAYAQGSAPPAHRDHVVDQRGDGRDPARRFQARHA